MEKVKLFGDMTPDEIERREKELGSLILFSDETGIEFYKSEFDDGEPALVIQVDGRKRPLCLWGEQIVRLREYLNLFIIKAKNHGNEIKNGRQCFFSGHKRR
jgi:hypothetical protein